MTDPLERAREDIQLAADRADRAENEQLKSIDEGLMELTESDKTQDTSIHLDRLAELEKKLGGLQEETDGEVERHVASAKAALDEARLNRANEEEQALDDDTDS